MRELIRPTLFMVAKLGLFLSVVAWVASQWIQLHLILDSAVSATMESKRFVAVDRSEPSCLPLTTLLTCRADEAFETLTEIESEPDTFGFCGWSHNESSFGLQIAVRHWLIVSVFALFYGVLKWVYGKRKGGVL